MYVPPIVGSTVDANAVSVRLEEALKALIAQHRVVSHERERERERERLIYNPPFCFILCMLNNGSL